MDADPTDEELYRRLCEAAGAKVTLMYCCPHGGAERCDPFYSRFCTEEPITLREALIRALRRRGIEL